VTLDFSAVGVAIIGVGLTIALIYYSLRTVLLFKRNVAARAWVYISLSAVFLSMGVVTFLVESLSQSGLLPVGGVLETVGALFLLIGLRKNFLFWASKDHFA
jgi:uncharacterized membrane protein YwzB